MQTLEFENLNNKTFKDVFKDSLLKHTQRDTENSQSTRKLKFPFQKFKMKNLNFATDL